MDYLLKHVDTPLLAFSADAAAPNPDYQIIWVNDSALSLFPYGLKPTPSSLESWVRHRAIPKNRAFVSTFLARNGLNTNRPLGIIAVCKGLSLNDCYWVTEAGSTDAFAQVNLYDNRMSRLLARIAFTGYGSSPARGFSSSPEFTTNGMLPKCWRRVDGRILLYKGGTSGFANAGFEPYSEVLAADAACSFGVTHVDYALRSWKGVVCSACELFTSKERSFVPASSMVDSGGFDAVTDRYRLLGPQFFQALSDMVAFDALICNTDRHLNNFGFLADNASNKIVAPAPLFDHGNALFYQAFGDDWSSDEALSRYAATQEACLYGDFFDTAKRLMTKETRAKVRSMLDFSFGIRKPRNFPKDRMPMIERQIRTRARQLLE